MARSVCKVLALTLNIILVAILTVPMVKVIVAAKLADEHRGTPDVATIGNRILNAGEVRI